MMKFILLVSSFFSGLALANNAQEPVCARAIGVAHQFTLAQTRKAASLAKEQYLLRRHEQTRALTQWELPEFRHLWSDSLTKLALDRDLITAFESYLHIHGTDLNQRAVRFVSLLLGEVPQSDDVLVEWSTHLLRPPKPQRVSAPDYSGLLNKIIRDSNPDDLSLAGLWEEKIENDAGLPSLVENFYFQLIQYHLDRRTLRRCDATQTFRRERLFQRHQPMNHVLLFLNPTKEQQHRWANLLKKDIWKNVPRALWINERNNLSFIQSQEFLFQTDVIRIAPRLLGTHRLNARTTVLHLVGSADRLTDLALAISQLSGYLFSPAVGLTVKIHDFLTLESADADRPTAPLFSSLNRLSEEAILEQLTNFEEWTLRKGNPTELIMRENSETGPMTFWLYPSL